MEIQIRKSVLPLTFEEDKEFKGQEYLELYPTITKSEYLDGLKYAWVKGKRLPDFIKLSLKSKHVFFSELV